MTDFILTTDPHDMTHQKQSTKIVFLQNEIKQLQEHVQDLEQIIKINKQALHIATGQVQPKNFKGGNDTTIENSQNPDIKNLHMLIDHLQTENQKLIQIIENVKTERNIAQSKALISEQICEEAQRHESEVVTELEDKINELRKLVQDKEYTIQELEKIKPIPESDGVVVKFREVLSPTEQNLRLHNDLFAANQMLAKISKEYNKALNDKQSTQALNFTLSNELAKIKATFASPLNAPMRAGNLLNPTVDLNQSAINYATMAAAFIDDENSPLPSPAPHKQIGATQSKNPVPKLDLSKAKVIQEQIAAKIGQQQQNPNAQKQIDPKILDKLAQVQAELEQTRKRLSSEMISSKLLQDEITRLQKENNQLSSTNDILIRSNRRYEEKWQKIFYTLEFYKEFYHKYIDLITNRRMWNRSQASFNMLPKLENAIKLRDRFNIDIDTSPDKLVKELKKLDEENGKQVNVSILDAQEDEINAAIAGTDDNNEGPITKMELQNPNGGGNITNFNKEQCKMYLLNMARDLYVNEKFNKTSLAKQVLKRLEFGQNNPKAKSTFRMKRSVSNPLDYLSERKKFIYEPNEKNKKLAKTKKQRKETRIMDDQDIEILKNEEIKLDFGDKSLIQKNYDDNDNENDNGILPPNEQVSFVVGNDDNKQNLVEVSFISTHEILDQMK